MEKEVKYEVKNIGDGIKTVKIGKVDFRVDNFKPKGKAEFLLKYKDQKKHVFDREEAWEFLKQFVKKAG